MADPHDSTRRLAPAEPPPQYPRSPDGDELTWREYLLDRFHSLRTAVILLGILATAALAVAVWALLDAQNDRQQPSGARIAVLQDRISALESSIKRVPTQDDVTALRDRQRALDDRLKAVEEAGRRAATQKDVAALQQRVDDLDKRVQKLEQQQAQPSPAATP
jgi:septal ring factor EnvC (AmiA/AmiB activator)